ncbi:MAG TPA: DUF6268 family outer membrane beta-barrel protein [Planctomycetota bacterium]|nr:DUF6268 family outer membrane beta-barrel protein [Planctomycetota bacterium]
MRFTNFLTIRWVPVFSLLLLAAAHLTAQVEQQPQPKPAEWDLSVELRAAFVEGGDLDDAEGELDTWIHATKLRLEGRPWRGGRLGFTLGHEHRRYDFDGAQPFIPSLRDPWKDVHTVSFGVQALNALSKDWAVFLGASAKASAAVDADLSDGVSGLLIGGIGWNLSDSFRLGVGAVALAGFEDDFRVFPAIQFDWKISETWRATLEALRFDLRYQPDPEWSFGIGAEVDGIRFRLADTPERGHGIIEDKRLSAFLGVTWTPNENIAVTLEGGVDLWRQIDIADRNGDNGDTFKSGTAPFVSLGLTLSF